MCVFFFMYPRCPRHTHTSMSACPPSMYIDRSIYLCITPSHTLSRVTSTSSLAIDLYKYVISQTPVNSSRLPVRALFIDVFIYVLLIHHPLTHSYAMSSSSRAIYRSIERCLCIYTSPPHTLMRHVPSHTHASRPLPSFTNESCFHVRAQSVYLYGHDYLSTSRPLTH